MSKNRSRSIPSSDPSNLPTPGKQRDRTSSLSIARSPSVLSSQAFTPSSETEDPSFPFLPLPSTSTGLGLTRTTSHPPHHRIPKPKSNLSNLSNIPSDDDLIDTAAKNPFGQEDGDVSLDLQEVQSEESDHRVGIEGYSGEFQRPDSKEMLVIMLSIAGVSILALAAGLATVFDWVL